MHVAMIGAGYVGLVSGACFADFGHDVMCVDNDAGRIDRLSAGEIPIYEPGLKDLVERNARAQRLAFSTDLVSAVAAADVVFIAVGTPSRRGDGHADLTYVYAAARQIADALSGYTVVVTKSTVPVGTGDEIERIIREVRPDADFAVVSNPEFLREGAAIEDFKRPDRIVIGTDDRRAQETMADLYRPLNLNRPPLLYMSRRASELTKYAANAFLATKITFINEIADLCEKIGANVQDVARGIGLDNRIGSKFLHAGPGYGGSCFPKDTQALIQTAQGAGAPLRIVETVAAANVRRKKSMAARIAEACGGDVNGKTIAILGLAFKPNTDDMRDAPSLDIVPGLADIGARVKAHDPESMAAAKPLLPAIEYCDDPYECARDADAIVIVTEWDAFRALNLDRLKSALKTPLVIDLRNIYRPEDMSRRGFRYVSIGRGEKAGHA
ncbi:MAG: UDP-glucose/GDP-mannose dehydrogenase family protein [Beijerinckiaceae bacterium]